MRISDWSSDVCSSDLMLTGNGHVNNHNLSIRGRGGATGYFLSGGFTDQSGFIKNDVYKRYDLRSNLETKVTEWLSFGLESFLTLSDYSGVAPSLSNAVHIPPYAPLIDEDGDYVRQPDGSLLNPFPQYKNDDTN